MVKRIKKKKNLAPAKMSGTKDIWRKARAIYCIKNVATSSTSIHTVSWPIPKGKIT